MAPRLIFLPATPTWEAFVGCVYLSDISFFPQRVSAATARRFFSFDHLRQLSGFAGCQFLSRELGRWTELNTFFPSRRETMPFFVTPPVLEIPPPPVLLREMPAQGRSLPAFFFPCVRPASTFYHNVFFLLENHRCKWHPPPLFSAPAANFSSDSERCFGGRAPPFSKHAVRESFPSTATFSFGISGSGDFLSSAID